MGTKVKEIRAWKTTDGMVFDDEGEANKHEKRMSSVKDLIAIIEDKIEKTSRNDVFNFIVGHKHTINKITKAMIECEYTDNDDENCGSSINHTEEFIFKLRNKSIDKEKGTSVNESTRD